jgi:sugar phosphate isomerase/epimerase
LRHRKASHTIKTLFAKACWEVYEKPLDWFIQQSVEAGWDATEIYLKFRQESREEVLRLHRESGLKLIAQISSTVKGVRN